jgi:hypothetical protein
LNTLQLMNGNAEGATQNTPETPHKTPILQMHIYP